MYSAVVSPGYIGAYLALIKRETGGLSRSRKTASPTAAMIWLPSVKRPAPLFCTAAPIESARTVRGKRRVPISESFVLSLPFSAVICVSCEPAYPSVMNRRKCFQTESSFSDTRNHSLAVPFPHRYTRKNHPQWIRSPLVLCCIKIALFHFPLHIFRLS